MPWLWQLRCHRISSPPFPAITFTSSYHIMSLYDSALHQWRWLGQAQGDLHITHDPLPHNNSLKILWLGVILSSNVSWSKHWNQWDLLWRPNYSRSCLDLDIPSKPDPVSSWKVSRANSGMYLDGRQPRNARPGMQRQTIQAPVVVARSHPWLPDTYMHTHAHAQIQKN